jgi:hypothetical protein
MSQTDASCSHLSPLVCLYEASLLNTELASTFKQATTGCLRPWTTVLLEKLIGSKPVKKFLSLFGILSLIILFKKTSHILSQMNPVRSFSSNFFKVYLLLYYLRLNLTSNLFTSRFPTQTLCQFLFSPMRVTCPVDHILLDFITLVRFDEDFTSWSSSLCNSL